jgi:Ca2+-binding RTX toxin-like protein
MFFTVLLPPTVETNRDRFDLVEGLSGWDRDDILSGDDRTEADIAGGHELLRGGLDRIVGLRAIVRVGPGAEDSVAFSGGNILLGGAGSDILEGRGGDDILDGDRWLDAQIRVTGTLPPGIGRFHDGMATLSAAVFSGQITPGRLLIQRTVRLSPYNPLEVDVAVFSGPAAEYEIVANANGSTTVTHLGGGIDGIDTLWNMEMIRFQDVDIPVPATP